MKKSRLIILLVAAVLAVAGIWAWNRQDRKLSGGLPAKTATPLSLALDWTPNTNHTGVYVAQKMGWYENAGLDLKILPYSTSVTADQLVAAGKADTGIGSTESVMADAGAGSPVVSIGAIIPHNTSVLAVKKDSGITSPKQLDGKIYGGFGAPYETAVINEVIKHDGGRGDFQNVTVDVNPIEALKSGQVDFVWIFAGWEAIQAERMGLELTNFPINAYGVPDYATPSFITAGKTGKTKEAAIKKFMRATARGYEYARSHPKQSARMLIDSVPKGTFSDTGLVFASQAYLSPRYQTGDQPWGIQNKAAWRNYPQFMLDNQAVVDASGQPVKKLDFDALYTNRFLE